MRTRLVLFVAALATAALIAGPVSGASASTTMPFKKNVPISGTASNGKSFKGTYTISRFARKNGKLYAVGHVHGKVGKRVVDRNNVVWKVTPKGANGARAAATCQVLNLVLGPLHLNLLGLHVDLNQVVLNITGETGAGNLLGNLVCGIAGILDPGSGLTSLTQFLNALTGFLSSVNLP
jgi:hypothetical protein